MELETDLLLKILGGLLSLAIGLSVYIYRTSATKLDKIYDMVQKIQLRGVTHHEAIEQHSKTLQDHEFRIRDIEKNTK